MSDPAAPKQDPGPVYQVTGWRVPLLWFAAVLVRLWCRTLRVEYQADAIREVARSAHAMTLLLWHNQLFMVSWLAGVAWRGRRVHALVSASRDGAGLSRFFSYIGVETVRGSSSRFGREALRELIAVLRAGRDISITPDGPRGPVYQFKPGAVLAARRAHTSLLLFGVQFTSAWRVRSWDRFYIPKPFSRVIVRHEVIDPQDLKPGAEGVEFVRQRLLILSGENPADWPAVREAAEVEGPAG